MYALWCQLKCRLHGETGASLVEYALLVGLIAVVCITAVTFFGSATSDSFSTSSSSLFLGSN